MFQGSANRKVAATNMNRASSRSHSVFTCIIESKVSHSAVLFSDIIINGLYDIIIYLFFFPMVFDVMPVTCYQWESQGVTHHRFARLNLVDLAGSER